MDKRSAIYNLILFGVLIVTVAYSFILANKRYINYEYGKFDLGNMSQMVWNTSQGRFMEVTDQFGENMPRWGMSHVDPILVIFAPIYWINSNPMILVFAQQLVILSAMFPIFWMVRKFTKSPLAACFAVGTYVLYPAIGFTLIWTGFHGISFVAPLLLWAVWLLEHFNFKPSGKALVLYWIFIIAILLGKEEIGSMLAILAIPLYWRNRKLAIWTFGISAVWFIIAFFVIIPAYSGLREQSINTFVEKTHVRDVDPDAVSGENFFLSRYSYLGGSYTDMIKTFFTNPETIAKEITKADKLNAINNLFGPLGYITAFVPVWLFSVPDLAIVLLSKDDIFDISNHRIAFVISGLFLSYMYLLYLMHKKVSGRYKSVSVGILSGIVFALTILFSAQTGNPLYISGESFVKNKLIGKVLAMDSVNDSESAGYVIGETRRSHVPRNDTECLNQMVKLIDSYNPRIYSGPDYLGAQSANREVNALFPARYWDADLLIADVYDTKSLGPLGSPGWPLNKRAMQEFLGIGRHKHIYSCGQVSAFIPGEGIDSSIFVESNEYSAVPLDVLETDKISVTLGVVDFPAGISRKDNKSVIKLLLTREKGDFHDKSTFWTFEKADGSKRFSYIDYLDVGAVEGLDTVDLHKTVLKTYAPQLVDVPPGEYNVFFGIGDLLTAREMFIGTINVL